MVRNEQDHPNYNNIFFTTELFFYSMQKTQLLEKNFYND